MLCPIMLILVGTCGGPASVECCSGSERRRICTPKWGHSAFSFWFWVVGDHPSALISQSKLSRGSWHVSRVAACNGAATRSGRPTHRHTAHNRRLSRTIGHRTHRKHLAAQMGGGIIPHTPEQRRHLTRQRSLDVAGALPSPIAFSTAACGHAPRRAGLGGRPRSRTRCCVGSVGSVPKADRLGCELRQPPFLYLDHVQAVGGRAGWPRAGGGEGVRR